jgi:hypothetical protein
MTLPLVAASLSLGQEAGFDMKRAPAARTEADDLAAVLEKVARIQLKIDAPEPRKVK